MPLRRRRKIPVFWDSYRRLGDPMEYSQTTETPSRRRAFAILAVIVVLAAGFRVYRLGEQSVWGDELYGGVGYLKAPTFGLCLDLIHIVAQENAPVYAGLQYFWSRIAGMEVLTLRFVPLFFGLASLPVLYGIGALVYGRKAGLVAAACLAASPVHIWYSQALRPYALVILLSLISMYAYLRALRDGGRGWWGLCLAANMVLVWTHFMLLFLVFVELGHLALHWRARFRAAVLWASLHGFLLVPWVLYVLRLRPSNLEHRMALTLEHVVLCAVGDEARYLICTRPFWLPHLSPLVQNFLVAMNLSLLYLLWGFVAVAVAWLVLTKTRTRALSKEGVADGGQGRNAEATTFLLVLITVPLSILLVSTALSGLPFLRARYLHYATMARYVVIGGLCTCCWSRFLRGLAVALLVAVWAYHLAFFVPSATRTDWRSVGEYIEENASSEDVIIAGCFPDAMTFEFNRCPDGLAVPMFSASNFQAACDASLYFLSQAAGEQPDPEEARSVWLVYGQQWHPSRLRVLEQGLASCGLTYFYKQFLGWESVIVYRVIAGRLLDTMEAPWYVPITEDGCYEDISRELGMADLTPSRKKQYAEILRRVIHDPPPYDYSVGVDIMCATQVLQCGAVDLARALAHKIAEGGSGSWAPLGLVLAAEGDTQGAEEAFEKAFRGNRAYARVMGPCTRALCESKLDVAYGEARRLEEMGFIFGVLMREYCRHRVAPEAPRLPFGLWASRERYYTAVLPELVNTQWRDLRNPAALVFLGQVLELQGRPEQAAAMHRKAANLAPVGASKEGPI